MKDGLKDWMKYFTLDPLYWEIENSFFFFGYLQFFWRLDQTKGRKKKLRKGILEEENRIFRKIKRTNTQRKRQTDSAGGGR